MPKGGSAPSRQLCEPAAGAEGDAGEEASRCERRIHRSPPPEEVSQAFKHTHQRKTKPRTSGDDLRGSKAPPGTGGGGRATAKFQEAI